MANNEFPTNPLITFETRHVDIFKVRNPIKNFRDKSVAILIYRAAAIKFEFKDSKMNQAGE
jgi:hypothetical protein